jgi:hypothetical protein
MSDAKQEFIDEVLTCDDVFQATFDAIQPAISENLAPYADIVETLKLLINEVLELDTAIRAQEARNRGVLEEQSVLIRSQADKAPTAPPSEEYIKNYGKYKPADKPTIDKKI